MTRTCERHDEMLTRQTHLRTSLLFFALLQPAACKEEKPSEPQPSAEPTPVAPVITVAKPVHDFGKVHLGSRVTHVFTIKNTGTADLVIENTAGS